MDMGIPTLRLPSRKGTYALILYLPSGCRLQVGRLGEHEFTCGYYLYIGSAFGPGGLAARIRHHVRPPDRPHWHIDYLRTVARLKAVWCICSDIRLEHPWAAAVERMPEVRIPVNGFGSTDCRCRSHLFHVVRKPRLDLFQAGLTAAGIDESIRQITDFSCMGIDKPVSLR